MQVSIDGCTEPVLNDVKVCWEGLMVNLGGNQTEVDLTLTATHEGIIIDIVDEEGFVPATASLDIAQLLNLTH